ncbi:MAG: DsrE family protein [Arcobacteraceae bacterium]|jgi:intracellular sulfur oxidation DsrE/DsrF family protein
MKNMIKKIFTLLSFGFALFALPTQTFADTSKYGQQKVVYHINYDSLERQIGALGNAQNQIDAVGESNMETTIVMHGKGLTLLQVAKTNGDLASKIKALKMQGVKFAVCNKTMEKQKLTVADLFDATQQDVVPSGVAELSYLQSKGYTYLRP